MGLLVHHIYVQLQYISIQIWELKQWVHSILIPIILLSEILMNGLGNFTVCIQKPQLSNDHQWIKMDASDSNAGRFFIKLNYL